jgi:hypothetical protein
MTPGNESDGRHDRSNWAPIEERRAQVERWKAEARQRRQEIDRWVNDGGRA